MFLDDVEETVIPREAKEKAQEELPQMSKVDLPVLPVQGDGAVWVVIPLNADWRKNVPNVENRTLSRDHVQKRYIGSDNHFFHPLNELVYE